MKGHPTIGERRRGDGMNLGRVFLIVLAIHAVAGGALLWLARTDAGKQFAKQYNIKLFEPPKPEEVEPEPEPEEAPPPPPPPVEQAAAPPPEVAAVAPAPAAAAPSIGGGGDGGPGSSWNGGRFVGGFAEGPDGAYHAGVTRLFREALPDVLQASTELELVVSASGQVESYRLARASGDAETDRIVLEAARKVQARGTPPPPGEKRRVVTVRLRPY